MLDCGSKHGSYRELSGGRAIGRILSRFPCPPSADVTRTALDDLPSRIAATILERGDGGPMRPVGRKRGVRPGGLYYSQKVGRHVGYESDNEKCGLFRVEVATEILSYREQPHTIEGVIDGELRRYTPDREDRFADGRVEIVEVKDDFEADHDPSYRRKIEHFAEVYDRLGWSFRVTTRAEIKAADTFSTIDVIQRYRRTSFTALDVASVRETFSGRGECALGELLAIFPSSTTGLSKLCAMMVGRVVALDLNSNLAPTSMTRLV